MWPAPRSRLSTCQTAPEQVDPCRISNHCAGFRAAREREDAPQLEKCFSAPRSGAARPSHDAVRACFAAPCSPYSEKMPASLLHLLPHGRSGLRAPLSGPIEPPRHRPSSTPQRRQKPPPRSFARGETTPALPYRTVALTGRFRESPRLVGLSVLVSQQVQGGG